MVENTDLGFHMSKAVRQRVRVQEGGRIELRSPELRAGDEAEVIVLVDEVRGNAPPPDRTNSSFLGAGQGSFRSASEADEFLRKERDQWPG